MNKIKKIVRIGNKNIYCCQNNINRITYEKIELNKEKLGEDDWEEIIIMKGYEKLLYEKYGKYIKFRKIDCYNKKYSRRDGMLVPLISYTNISRKGYIEILKGNTDLRYIVFMNNNGLLRNEKCLIKVAEKLEKMGIINYTERELEILMERLLTETDTSSLKDKWGIFIKYIYPTNKFLDKYKYHLGKNGWLEVLRRRGTEKELYERYGEIIIFPTIKCKTMGEIPLIEYYDEISREGFLTIMKGNNKNFIETIIKENNCMRNQNIYIFGLIKTIQNLNIKI